MPQRWPIDKTDRFRAELEVARQRCEPIDRAISAAEAVLAKNPRLYPAAPYHPGCQALPVHPPCRTSFLILYRLHGGTVVFERLLPVPAPEDA